MADISTSVLWQRILKTRSIRSYLKVNEHHMQERTLSQHLNLLCIEKERVREHVIRDAGIERGFGHQIFRGTRKPSREKLLQLAFAFPLTLEETQRLLLIARKRALHPRVLRDSALIICLREGASYLKAQSRLDELALPALGDDAE